MNYAGIGTRYPSEEQAALCSKIGTYLAVRGYVLHTGAAPGVDQLFTRAALKAGGRVVLHLPWPKHEQEFRDSIPKELQQFVEVRVLQSKKKERDHIAFDSVDEYHPASTRLSWGALCLHARNYRIVVPEDDHPVDFVLAYPSPHGGGTMQGVRIAHALERPVVRLDQLSPSEARAWINDLTRTHT